MNTNKKLKGYKELADMRNGALKAYERCYRRYALKDCIEDTYEWGAYVQCRHICENILKIDADLLDMIDKKVDSELCGRV